MKTADFDYSLPDELIAKYPTSTRSASRLLCVAGAELADKHFSDIVDFFRAGDVLVLNDTKVLAARLFGHKQSGGKVEVLLERVLPDNQALCHIRASRAPQAGSKIIIADDFELMVTGRLHNLFIVEYHSVRDIYHNLQRYGHMPLPPYIDRADSAFDESRYQTVFAERQGAVAAPTAGLHFDDGLLQQIAAKGVELVYLTLHVGAGTFAPVKTEFIEQHQMHAEYVEVGRTAAAAINACRARGGRVFACGTTVVRSLESAPAGNELAPWQGDTSIFIYPGFQFRFVDQLLTNFHLPQSTLLMLVSAFAGSANIKAAYRHAIEARYRFFSYGDAMLLSAASL